MEVEKSYKSLFNKPLNSDVIFTFTRSDDISDELYAHSVILSLRSSVFKKNFAFNAKNGETKSRVFPIYSKYDVFECFLRYLYGAKHKINCKNAVDLRNLAIKYEVPCLILACQKFCLKNILTLDEKCKYLNMSLEAEHRTDTAIDLVKNHRKLLLKEDLFKKLTAKALEQVISKEMNFLDVTVMTVFQLVIKWAEYHCSLKGDEINPINTRKELGDVIKLIKFRSMELSEFNDCIKEYPGILLPTEEKIILASINNPFCTDDNDIRFWMPREVNMDELTTINMEIFTGILRDFDFNETGVPSGSIFTLSRVVYLLSLSIAAPRLEHPRNVFVKISCKGYTLAEVTQYINCIDPLINFDKPIKLIPGYEYVCDIKYDKGEDQHFEVAFNEREVPFTLSENGFEFFKFTEYSPLLRSICCKTEKQIL